MSFILFRGVYPWYQVPSTGVYPWYLVPSGGDGYAWSQVPSEEGVGGYALVGKRAIRILLECVLLILWVTTNTQLIDF